MNTERSSFIHIKSNAFITIIKFGLDCGVEARVMGREMKMTMSELRSISQIFLKKKKVLHKQEDRNDSSRQYGRQ